MRIAVDQRRIVLSRSTAFVRQVALHALVIESEAAEEQLLHVNQKFDIIYQAVPFSLCLRCNGKLSAVRKKWCRINCGKTHPYIMIYSGSAAIAAGSIGKGLTITES